MRHLLACILALVLGLASSGCSSTGLFSGHDGLDPEDVPPALVEAEAALARDDAQKALEILGPASRSIGLTPEVRDNVQLQLEKAAQRRIEQLSGPDSDPDELADMVELELPRQIAVQAGLAAARRYVDMGEPMDAYDLLKKLDDKFPLHHERVASGNLMADVGLALTNDTPTLFGWFDTLGEAQEVLEYVILKTPWAKRCDEAYWALSASYEVDQNYRLAIERAQGLVLNHPGSPLATPAQARVPQLRLSMLASTEYDRQELTVTRQELQEWLVRHGGHELELQVRIELGDCLRRMCESDLLISRFYDTVDNPFGARRHAQRAIEEARDAGDAERVAKAEAWLASLPKAVNPLTGTETLP